MAQLLALHLEHVLLLQFAFCLLGVLLQVRHLADVQRPHWQSRVERPGEGLQDEVVLSVFAPFDHEVEVDQGQEHFLQLRDFLQ